jgi:hypothetical protein
LGADAVTRIFPAPETEPEPVFGPAREKHLDSIARQTADLWEQVAQLVASQKAKNYDLAVQHLADLRDLAARKGTPSDFAERMAAFRKVHGGRSAVSRRLREKGP